VEVDRAGGGVRGGGRAAARGEGLPAVGSRAEEHVREEEEERGGGPGAYLEISEIPRTSR
jgi:hypothetical protein